MRVAPIGRSYPSDGGWAKPPVVKTSTFETSDRVPAPIISSPYRAGGFDRQDTAEWSASFGSADSDLLQSRDVMVARVRDVVRNDPTARAAVERLSDMVVGEALRLSAKPDAVALGITPEAARDLSRQMQAEFRAWSCTHDPHRWCDAQQRLSFDGMARVAMKSYVVTGEACAAMDWRKSSNRYSTCVLQVDPDRVCNPHNKLDSQFLRGGVDLGQMGQPLGYHVREAHPGDWFSNGLAWNWKYVPRFTDWGRPVFVHAFEPDREGQTKAVPPFAALVSRLRMIGKFADNELASAAANALFAAFVTSDLPPEEVRDKLTVEGEISDNRGYAASVMKYYERHPARVGGVRIPTMLPGSEIKMNSAPRQTTAFPAFQTAFLHSIASSLNLSYEQLTMDWSRVNYSSARAALNEVWRSTRRMRRVLVEQYVCPIYYCVMEEAFQAGYLKAPKGAPNFDENPNAYLGGRWIGPGRGVVDSLKEAEAASMRMENMTSTLEIECAELGHDYLEIMDQISIEEAELQIRGLSRKSLIASVNASRGPKPDSAEVQEAIEQAA